MDIEGTIKNISEETRFESGFYKRTLLLETGGEYPQVLPIDFLKEKADGLRNYRAGQKVKVAFDLRGKEYNGRHFVDLNGWKVSEA
jgi:single-strand DNA-binding protein